MKKKIKPILAARVPPFTLFVFRKAVDAQGLRAGEVLKSALEDYFLKINVFKIQTDRGENWLEEFIQEPMKAGKAKAS